MFVSYIPFGGQILDPYRLGKRQKVENGGVAELITKLHELPWRYSLSVTEPTYILRKAAWGPPRRGRRDRSVLVEL